MDSYDGAEFEPINGFATTSMGDAYIALGTGPLRCGSEDSSSPPSGYTAAITLPEFVVGSYSSVFVRLLANVSGFEGVGSNDGTVDITEVTATTVAGTIDYSYTNGDGETFDLVGDFEVILCAP